MPEENDAESGRFAVIPFICRVIPISHDSTCKAETVVHVTHHRNRPLRRCVHFEQARN